jgi:hypothetical protein
VKVRQRYNVAASKQRNVMTNRYPFDKKKVKLIFTQFNLQ